MHPQRWWFLADLARQIGVPPSSLQREMGSLVEAGILLRRQEGKQVYFKPDPNCPILFELQGTMSEIDLVVKHRKGMFWIQGCSDGFLASFRRVKQVAPPGPAGCLAGRIAVWGS